MTAQVPVTCIGVHKEGYWDSTSHCIFLEQGLPPAVTELATRQQFG